jgi:hypothetical protein
MSKRFAAALLAALSLAALSLTAGAQDRGGRDRDPIDVQVVNGQVVVEEEEARTSADQGGLVWRVVTPGYRFADDGIVIQSEGRHRCGPVANGQRYRCAKLRHLRGERYKYDVKLVNARTGEALPVLDPWIIND